MGKGGNGRGGNEDYAKSTSRICKYPEWKSVLYWDIKASMNDIRSLLSMYKVVPLDGKPCRIVGP